MAVGSLVVKLGLDAVDYINGFNKAEQQAAKFAETSKKTAASIDRQVKSLQLHADLLGKSAREAKLYELAQKGATQAQLDSANAALRQVEAFEKATVIGRNLGIALAAGAAAAVAGFIKLKEVVGVLDDLDEAADAAGTTAVSLANLRRAALDAGVDASQLDKALTKLNTTMSDAASGNEKAIEKFRLLGISIKDSAGNLKSSDELLKEFADKFAGFSGKTEKAALAAEFFGEKVGPRLVALLNQGRGGLESYNQVSQSTIDAAKQLQTQFDRLGAEIEKASFSIVGSLAPAINVLLDRFNQAITKTGDLDVALNRLFINRNAERLKNDISLAEDKLKDLEKSAAKAKDALTFGGQGSLIDKLQNASQGLNEGRIADQKKLIESLRKELGFLGDEAQRVSQINIDRFLSGRSALNQAGEPGRGRAGLPTAPNISGAGSGSSGADLAKKQLDNFLKEAERAVQAESELLSTRNKFLDLFNRQGLVSIEKFYDARRAIVDEAARNQVAQFDRMIEAEREFQRKSTKPEAKIESEGKINELLNRRAKVTREASEATIELGIQQNIATEAFARQLDAVNVEILELTGNLKKAAEIRFDNQFDNFRKQLEASGNADAIKKLDDLRRFKVAQAEFDQEQEKSSRITQQLGIEEERLSISRQAGAITELGFLKSLGDRRKEQLAQLRAVVEAQEAIARASPDNQKLVQNAERARLELEKLAAVADPLADKFNSIFEESFGDAFGDFITGAKTAKEAFTDFANSVANQISRMAAQDIASSVFGKGGVTGGGFGSILAQIFGSSGGSVPIFANGTDYVPQTGLALVHQGEKIITAADNRTGNFGNRSTTINVNFAGEVSRASGQQLGADLARRLALSDARVN